MARHTSREHRPQAVEPDYSSVPTELRTLNKWVLWRYDWHIGQAAWAKVPYQPSGSRASTTNPEQWSSFESCLLTIEQTKGKFDGIGFVFSESDEYIGVDLDNCVAKNEDKFELTPFAARAVEKLATYTELSPSLTGLHCIGRAKVLEPVKTKFNEDDIEMYGTGRYFTFTGRSWHDAPLPIEDINTQAKEIIAFCKQKQTPNQPQVKLPLDIDARLEIALRNSRTKRIFEGDISEYGNDDSRGDMALLNMLAYYSDGRADVLDAMFRQSKLMRPKWDSSRGNSTYGAYSIDKVLAGQHTYLSTRQQNQTSIATYDTRKNYRFSVSDLWEKAMQYRVSGDAKGVFTGWKAMNEFYLPTKRALHVVTGVPGSGKSTWTDALCYNLAKFHGWKFTFASFETLPIERHILNLCQIHLQKPTFAFVEGAASDKEMEQARIEIGEFFHFILPPDEQMDLASILNFVDDDLRDYQIDGFVLDPFTELDKTPTFRGQSHKETIGDILTQLQAFTRRREIATWLIAHPTKPNPDTFQNGVPTLYSINGSSDFYNKADFGITVHRDDDDKTSVHITKVRNDINGKKGKVEFFFDKHAKSYSPIGDGISHSPAHVSTYGEDVADDLRFR